MSRVLAGLAVALLVPSVLLVLSVLLAAAAPAAQEGIIFSLPSQGGGPGMPPPQAPARDNQPPRRGTAGIRGRVVAADTGQPLRRAQVRVTAFELRENRATMTDAEGRYELKELPAGRYNVTASKGNYLALQHRQTRPFEAGKPIEIFDKQILEKVDFSLPRSSVVTGRVVDEFGEPLPDMQVAAMRYRYMQGRRQLMPAGRFATTNDIGEFRLFALPPGQYYVSATLRSEIGMMGDSDDRSGYAPAYYPGTSNIAEAQRVTLDVGEMLTDITMTLTPTKTARVSGTAVNSTGEPFVGATVMVVPRQRAGMMMATGANQVKPDGSFVLSGLPPGDYVLQALTPGLLGQSAEFATADVTVSGDDIDGMRLVGIRPSTISGRIAVDPAAAQSLQLASMRITLLPADLDSPMMPAFGGMGGGGVKEDFTFEVSARPGKWRVMSVGGPAGWAIKSVRADGVDVTDSGIEVHANANVENVEIEPTNVLSNVSGLVTNSRGDLVTNYSLVVFARDRDRWTPGSRYLRSARPDQDGRFKVTGLPAGDYHVVALDYIEQGAETDPETLEQLESKAAAFSLDDGETKTLDLKLNSVD